MDWDVVHLYVHMRCLIECSPTTPTQPDLILSFHCRRKKKKEPPITQNLQASISGMLSIAPKDGIELRSAEGSTESKNTVDHWESKSKENFPS